MSEKAKTYRFRVKGTDKVRRLKLTLDELFERQTVCGTIVLEDGTELVRIHEPPRSRRRERSSASPWRRPLKSVAAGVHPSQIDEFRADAREAGFTGVDFSADGDVLFSTRRQRRNYLRFRGLIDRDGGYGD